MIKLCALGYKILVPNSLSLFLYHCFSPFSFALSLSMSVSTLPSSHVYSAWLRSLAENQKICASHEDQTHHTCEWLSKTSLLAIIRCHEPLYTQLNFFWLRATRLEHPLSIKCVLTVRTSQMK